jgi:hypothetical protein
MGIKSTMNGARRRSLVPKKWRAPAQPGPEDIGAARQTWSRRREIDERRRGRRFDGRENRRVEEDGFELVERRLKARQREVRTRTLFAPGNRSPRRPRETARQSLYPCSRRSARAVGQFGHGSACRLEVNLGGLAHLLHSPAS